MVFESLVVELVNRYLGDFIENLDRSQLKIGIWGGDVVLNNLFVKESALDDLDLPIKVLHGNIGRLTLKVPWKNLYGEPTVAILEGMSVVAVPNAGVAFNAEKEAAAAFEAKQKELLRIEEAKKAEAEKHLPKDEQADSFAEKMASNVIKNLQIEISDIHVRYEDHFTNPQQPFAAGVTLKQLSFKTTDENWKPTVVKDAVTMIYKMVQMDSLAVYWNSCPQYYTQMDREKLQGYLGNNIISSSCPTNYKYLIEPISSNAKLRLNTKPEKENFSLPKLLLKVVFDEIAIALTKAQYDNVMELLEALERMNLATTYKKYRPSVPKRGHSKAWWNFAYTSILEEVVRRRRRMWSWEHIKQHRRYCREYKDAYKRKLSLKKIPHELQGMLDFYENELSLFNLTLTRQQAEMEAKKEAAKIQAAGGGGWFGGWFGGGSNKAAEKTKAEDIGEQFAKLMTASEKEKLYSAIDYQENTADPTMPVEFVATELHVALSRLSVTLRTPATRHASSQELLHVAVADVRADIAQRPAASAIRINTAMSTFTVKGTPDPIQGVMPEMVTSLAQLSKGVHQLRLMFETSPLDKSCDQRVDVAAEPLNIIYDAVTINGIVKFFHPPESVHLKQLHAAAMSKFEDLKEQTSTGLQHAIEQRKYTDIRVHIKPTQILLPEGGVYNRDCRLLLLDLGVLHVSSQKTDFSPENMVGTSLPENISGTMLDMEKVKEKAFDIFMLKLNRVQLLFVSPGDDWQQAQMAVDSPLHILRPMDINIELHKSILIDPNLPKMKVRGVLPSINMCMSDRRLQQILQLVDSIPFPEPDPTSSSELHYNTADVAEMMVMEGDACSLVFKMAATGGTSSSDEDYEDARESQSATRLVQQSSMEYINAIDVQLDFEIREIALHLSQVLEDGEVPILKIVVGSLGTSVQVRTYDLMVSAYLGSLYIQHLQFKATKDICAWYRGQGDEALEDGPLINIVNTPTTDDATYRLLSVEYIKANTRGPEFSTTYNNTEQTVKVHFTALEVLLHQEAILSVMAFAQNLVPPNPTTTAPDQQPQGAAAAAAAAADGARVAGVGGGDVSHGGGGSKILVREANQAAVARRAEISSQRLRRLRDSEVIDITVEATLDEFAVALCTQARLLTDVKVKGISAKVNIFKAKTTIEASLSDLAVHDPTDSAMYPKILAFEGGEVFGLSVVAHNGATAGHDYHDMARVDTSIALHTGTMNIVFLNKFVMELLAFLDNFSTAKDHIAAAGSAAAETAAAAAQDFGARASRVSLDISFKAPLIIVPQSSASNNALLVDLGLITVANRFETAGKYSAEGLPAVLDHMQVKLSAMKLSRASMLGTEIRGECCILQPVNMDVNLSRNLSASWYHGHPDINIDGVLESITVDLSQGDFTTLMSVLSENLQEGQPPPTLAAVEVQPSQDVALLSVPARTSGAASPRKAVPMKASPSTTSTKIRPTVAKLELPSQAAAAAAAVYAQMKFSFKVHNICAVLYMGDCSLVSGLVDREVKQGLGKIELQTIMVDGAMKSDNSMQAAVSLGQCVLDDCRPYKENSITRMVDRSSLGNQQSHMIDVDFVQQPNSDKDMVVKVNGVYVCVCVDYLMAIADFFVKGLPQPQEGALPPHAAHNATAAKATTGTHAVVAAPDAVAPAPPAGEFSLSLTVDQPEIILVENAMNPDTLALILQTQVTLTLRLTPDVQKISGSVADLQIFSCLFAKEHRLKTKTTILNPSTIALHSSAPTGQGMHVDIMMTDIIMNISPATIRLITAALSSLSSLQMEEEADTLSLIPKDLWSVKKLDVCDLWYLKTAFENTDGSSVDLGLTPDNEEVEARRGEQLLLSVDKIEIKLEGGVGKRTLPLLITEMTFRSEVLNWSSKMEVSGDVNMEVAYYNEYNAVWEPLLEPVEVNGKHRPWELGLQVSTNTDMLDDDPDPADVPTLPPPKMAITVKSKDLLQTTITKTCLEVLTNLGKAFNDAYNLVEQTDTGGEAPSPYKFKNETGQVVTLRLDRTFELPSAAVDGHVELAPGEQISLHNNVSMLKENPNTSVIKSTQDDQQKTVFIVMEDLGATRELRVVKAEKRAFGINQRAYPGEVWMLVSQTDVSYGCKTITLRSILAVHNHLPYTMELYYKLSDDAMGRCGEVAPNQILHVPMDAVYAAPYQLFFKPRDARFAESKTTFNWKELRTEQTTVSCEPTSKGLSPLYFSAKVEKEKILFESTGLKSAELYSLHLHPVVVLRNHLPIPVQFTLDLPADQASAAPPTSLEPGHSASLFSAKPGATNVQVKILEYMGREWLGSRLIEDKPEPLSVMSFEAQGAGEKQTMDLGIHCEMEEGYRELSIYCPYWMINKTGRTLTYKSADDYNIEHDGENKEAILFSFKSKAFFGKKKASLKVSDSEWSDKFSLDTVGSQGTISCKFRGYTFEPYVIRRKQSDDYSVFRVKLGVKITLASTGLTKIVTFTPYYMIINQAKFTVSLKEPTDAAVWYDVPAGECVPFWPVQADKKKMCVVRIAANANNTPAAAAAAANSINNTFNANAIVSPTGTKAEAEAEAETQTQTLPFCFVDPHTTLLRLDCAFGGVNVECQVMEAAVQIVCQQYTPGSACVQLVNHTNNAAIQYSQSGVNDVKHLGPGQAVLYTWQDPLGKFELVWSCGEKKNQKNELLSDVIDQFMYDPDTSLFYVSFLDGMQRVMLFTEDVALATKAQQAGELEQTAQEMTVSLAGVGLSLVDNTSRREIAYMGLTGSGVVWELRKKKLFKALKQKQIVMIERAYQAYTNAIVSSKRPNPRVLLDGGKIEVDFAANQMFKPTKAPIRRSLEDGVWMQYSASPHRMQYHIKIHNLQLDNQLPGAVFQTVLARIPPPKSVAADSVPKPFTEISVTIRKRDFSNVMQFKYCKILVQEMSVQLDQGFLNAILGLFSSDQVKEEYKLELFDADRMMIGTDLLVDASLTSFNEQKHFYDNLHFSPLKIHLSFSLYGAENDGNQPTALQSNVLNLFLQSVGIVLTDIQDVVFKLGYFERNFSFYNQSQLTGEIARHYSQQAIKQMYVLVLGLDVLGNPFGLIRGFAEGIEDLFYEPYQGAIQGPQEFAEGLALGVRSLFGNVVGGAAGAVSRITGALGKGLATLTLDDDYQRKRREQLNKRPADLKEGLARGGKGLVMGVVDGVTGIVLRPVEGAKSDGAAGFFKGVGKGLMGVVTRPASGVVDFASSSFQGIQRVAEMGDEVHRLRPPRFLHEDGIVRAFAFKEAQGNDILNDVAKSKFALDGYVAHSIITKDEKNVLLVTQKRVLFACKGEIFGHWECDWQYVWEDLRAAPQLTPRGIQVLLKEKQKKSLFSSGTIGKLVAVENTQEATWIVQKMQKAMSASVTK